MQAEDTDKIEQALNYIEAERGKGSQTKLAEAISIGGYIFREFFDGNPLLYTDKGKNSPSMRGLVGHPRLAELDVSRTTLMNYVTVYLQVEWFEHHIAAGRLPLSVRDLGYTHRVRLAPARAVNDRIAIAKRAAEEHLSPQQIEVLVANANKGTGTPVKRNPPSVAAKTVAYLRNAVYAMAEADPADVDDAEVPFVVEVLERIERHVDLLKAGWDLQRARVEEAHPRKPVLSTFSDIDLDDLIVQEAGNAFAAPAPPDTDAILGRLDRLGGRIVAELRGLDPDVTAEWVAGFLDSLHGVVPVDEPPTADKRTWFVIGIRDVIPADLDSVFDFFQHAQAVEPWLRVQADSPDEALRLAIEQVKPVVPPERTMWVTTLLEHLQAKSRKVKTVTAYLRKPRALKLPTLVEYAGGARMTGSS